MEWGFVVLILGALIYVAGIIIDYTNFYLKILPRISGTEDRAVEIAGAAEKEKEEHEDILVRIKEGKTAVEEFQKKIDDQKKELRDEQIRQKRLEMALLKSRLKGNRGLILA
tara:strand:- start:114 stop:449 length:336 start_codon:yes stop_codon:yes gene_type:complete